jgi:hypothetical protein
MKHDGSLLQRDLRLTASDVDFVKMLGRAGVMQQNPAASSNMDATSNVPPADAICSGGGSVKGAKCLQWGRQMIGTCCRLGHLGVLCAQCIDGWVKANGLCRPCQSFNYIRLVLLLCFYTGLTIYFWHKASRIKEPQHVDQKCQSAGLSISTFFLQTVALLGIDTGVDVSIGLLNLELDSSSASDTSVEGTCLSTGSFYTDWGFRFLTPPAMAVLAVALCLATRRPTHQVRTALKTLNLWYRVIIAMFRNLITLMNLSSNAAVANAPNGATLWTVPVLSKCAPSVFLPLGRTTTTRRTAQ